MTMQKSPPGSSSEKGLGITELRHWDQTLLNRYRPVYHPVSKACCLCGLGPCDLDKGRRGACGQDLRTFLSREALLMAVTGAAAHASHARDIVELLLKEKGPGLPLSLGEWIQIRMPITRIVTGRHPAVLSDLLHVLGYIDAEIVQLLASAHFGGESSHLDLESKILHAGTMDILSMEIADIAQISGYGFPAGDAGATLIPLSIEQEDVRPLILCVGHHSAVGQRILDIIDAEGMAGEVSVAGLCCTAHDMIRGRLGRAGHAADKVQMNVAGNLRDQLVFARSGRAHIVVADQQCVRLDLSEEVLRTGAFFIATSGQSCAGLQDETDADPSILAADLNGRRLRAVFMSDPEKAARLAIALAVNWRPSVQPTVPAPAAMEEAVERCTDCGLCSRFCPAALPVSAFVFSRAKGEANAEITPAGIASRCITCGRCDTACPQGIPVMALIGAQAHGKLANGLIRAGRGPIDDYEIKTTGPSIVLGDIPGVVAFLTCPEYPDARDSLAWTARSLAERGYIVLAAGCAALDLGRADGMLYRDFPGTFDAGGVLNTGSCVSSAHAVGALIKVASIFLHRRLDRNYVEIADYILNRIGAVGVLWGGVTPKSFSASAGANRLGIPVVFGPHGTKFRRTLDGGQSSGMVLDARSGREVLAGIAPAHLTAIAHTKEELIIQIARLCIRPNDTTWGRQTKLRNYLELSETLVGVMPADLKGYVRVPDDLPEERRDDLLNLIRAWGWEPSYIPDPTLLDVLVRSREGH